MSYEEILKKVIEYWENVIKDDVKVLPESRFVDDLSISSMEMFVSAIHIENTFGVRIKPKYFRKILTVQDAAKVIYELQQEKV